MKFIGKVYTRVRSLETIEKDSESIISFIEYQNNGARLRTITVGSKMKT